MSVTPVSYTVSELWARGRDDIPDEFVSGRHLIYSSPAALAFNSPGAEGFGVKRAGLAIPGSVMLVVSPGCCGRNTSSVSELPGYENRFFYLEMSETDLITSRHLRRIPQAVRALCESLPTVPSVVMVCVTCVDALLGTDMERVCHAAQDEAGVPVRPCYMYALTREGTRPPMVSVRQSLYSLLEPAERDARACNLLGHFAPIEEGSDLKALLAQAGLRHVREVSTAADFSGFQGMAEANFNLVLDPEAAPAAQDLERRLGIPWIELTRLYEEDRIHAQYDALATALGVSFDQGPWQARARGALRSFRERHPREVFAVGEGSNANPFELALALVRQGCSVREVFGTVTPGQYVYLRHLADLSPQTRVYSNLEPTMIGYDPAGTGVTLTIGRDAGYYHPACPNLAWDGDEQPFGYTAVSGLFGALDHLLFHGDEGRGVHGAISLAGERRGRAACRRVPAPDAAPALRPLDARHCVRGLRRMLTPFAPDQSGAASVLYGMGGITVVVDAGGCVGNICGFDEPRWFAQRDAIFSAGLRDMDAILGRDDLLVQKLELAHRQLGGRFVALVGTPVPAVIGTDLTALCHLAERRCGLPAIALKTNGMDLYDRGAEAAYLVLLTRFVEGAPERPVTEEGRIGVWGATPLDVSDPDGAAALERRLRLDGWRRVTVFGMGATLDELRTAGAAERNLVVSPAGLKAAQWLQRRFGTPYDVDYPLADALIPRIAWAGHRVLVVHQQVAAHAIRTRLLARGASDVIVASFFMQPDEARRDGDLHLREEGDVAAAVRAARPTAILADVTLRKLVGDFAGDFFDETHYALSGHLVRT